MLSELYLEKEFGEERGSGGWAPPPHRTPESRSLSASAARACMDQASDSSMLASERRPFVSVMAECICPCSYILSGGCVSVSALFTNAYYALLPGWISLLVTKEERKS